MTHYEIQIRQQGSWQAWIAFKASADCAMIDADWKRFCGVHECAARLAKIDGERVSILDKKRRGCAKPESFFQ